MIDEQHDELMQFALNEVEGPTLLAPRPPKPYYSCKGCKYFSKSMAKSGGLRHAPTYFKSCTQPDANRSLNSGPGGDYSGREVTPKWCPLLGDANE